MLIASTGQALAHSATGLTFIGIYSMHFFSFQLIKYKQIFFWYSIIKFFREFVQIQGGNNF